MKKIIYFSLLLLSVFLSCKKYEQDHGIRLKTVKKRLCNREMHPQERPYFYDKIKDTTYTAPEIKLVFHEDYTVSYFSLSDYTDPNVMKYTSPKCFLTNLRPNNASIVTWRFDTKQKEGIVLTIDGKHRVYRILSLTRYSFIIKHETDEIVERYILL